MPPLSDPASRVMNGMTLRFMKSVSASISLPRIYHPPKSMSGLELALEQRLQPDRAGAQAEAKAWLWLYDHAVKPAWQNNGEVYVVRVMPEPRPELTARGFAQAWTDRYVLVQVLWRMSYFQAARSFWVDADKVRRRVIPPKLLGPVPVPALHAR